MEVIWSDSAISSLLGILKYIKSKFDSQTAFRTEVQLRDSINKLLPFPKSGKLINTRLSGDEIRFWVIGKSKVFYILTKSEIIIFLVWDSRRNPKLLDNILSRKLKTE